MNLRNRSERSYLQALALHKELKNLRGESAALAGLGASYRQERRFGDAERTLQSAAEAARRGKFPVEEARALRSLGETHSIMGRHSEAITGLRLSLAMVRETSRLDLLSNQISLGRALTRAGQSAEAIPVLQQALAFAREIENSVE